MNKINYKLINFLLIIIIFFFIIKLEKFWIIIFFYLKKILIPIIISFSIAYIFYPIIIFLNKKIKNIKISTFLVFLFFILFFFFGIYYSIPIFIRQILVLEDEIVYFLNNLNNNIPYINLSSVYDYFIDYVNKTSNFLLSKVFSVAIISIKTIIFVFIEIILSSYFVCNMRKLKNYIFIFLKKYKNIYLCVKNIDIDLNKYLKGLFIIMFLEGVEYTILYFIIGHPNYILIGILSFIAPMIPCFGSLIANVLAVVTASTLGKWKFIITCVISIVMPLIDSYVIDPKIYQKTTMISPFKIMISIVVCSSVFGPIGIFLSIPIIIIIENIIKVYKKK